MGHIQKYLPRCLNCGNDLKATDQFCSNCGQRTQGSKVPLREFIGDFFQDYFTVDSKFFRSIFLLLIKPGRLTLRFNSGKRKSYIAPLRMYLFTSFIYFFLLSLSIKQEAGNFGFPNDGVDEQKVQILDSLMETTGDTLVLADLRNRVTALNSGMEESQAIHIESEDSPGEDGLGGFLALQAEKANNDIQSFIRALLRVASISLFFLLPLFAMVLWAFHAKRQSFYVPHLVHALHLHTFGFAVLSIYLLISFWVEAETFVILPIILFIYFVWSLKVVYAQKLVPSFFKALTIVFFYFILVLAALIPVVMLAIALV